ncbi:carbamoyl-phosphate synthase large subunit [Desulfohalobium retbaense]|uniref:Carbamoyl phosphate synthase large chain n=1 Tax=Desulfohalobium retbaense (strain ATCC 49708 / DSM 5692 / JCM 16813 / HR100) TaxID=485915 RepID=C8WZZ7_DESRD|nr:carbamoyl-phosphate synthase large subunit [Desulfohalobium retbaense]ACV67622.1 carbamoyl-phosphate synthase, large subunit [Desulfohalobium retbaense DSM 5692]
MPKRTDIRKIMLIGSGPIIIGQACEFDYSGTQALKALKEEGYEVVLINSNPATIMTDPGLADRTYVEPLEPESVAKIIAKERPDALLPTLGGQTGLNTAVSVAESGVLEKYGVELIGASLEVIQKAESRRQFRTAMENIGLTVPQSGIASSLEEVREWTNTLSFPMIVRPAFTLGGTGGGVAYNREDLEEIARQGLAASPSHEVMLEESVLGWKEYELEVMRDKHDNCVIICSIENLDAMGVHTGDSVTVAPAQTLTDREFQKMRDASLAIMREIGVETGGSNVQFAVNPENGDMVVIEMNPRVSRSSALASKATGFPIAKIAAKLAVGYTLDEIPNDITRETMASFEPTIDYCVVKIPRFTFEKFPGSQDFLTTTMKSVGETMAIGRTFKESLQKGLRSLEVGMAGLGNGTGEDDLDAESLMALLKTPNSQRLFAIRDALRQGMPLETLYQATFVDPWFLQQIKAIVDCEAELKHFSLEQAISADNPHMEEVLRHAKEFGFSDLQLANLWKRTEDDIRQLRIQMGITATYKLVDTCAAEFEAYTPYYYSSYERENENRATGKRKVVILGGGPNRIGQGIEFDYCCVHASYALRDMDIESVMVNSNPETVSTDYDTSDRLYFEPLTREDVLNIIEQEQPEGVIVQFGGQTPLNLAVPLLRAGVPILGTTPDSIDRAEDRERFHALLNKLGLKQPDNGLATSEEGALDVAERIGYPVVVRPSYVLGGRAMEIVYDSDELKNYFRDAVVASPDHPILIDKFLQGAVEIDVDALCDGTQTYVGGVMEHIEEAGVHSGDSACVLPPHTVSQETIDEIRRQSSALAEELGVVGLMNVQFAVQNGEIFILEVNPRASRTVPFVSKATGVPLAKLATQVMMGRTLEDLNPWSMRQWGHLAVKEAVMPFNRFPGVDVLLGPEMRSTGEVMGVDTEFGLAFMKAQLGAGQKLPASGTVFISVNDADKDAVVEAARTFARIGLRIVSTEGTAAYLTRAGVDCERVNKVYEGRPNAIDLIKNGEIDLVINTSSGKKTIRDSSSLRQTTLLYGIPYTTTVAGARAMAQAIAALQGHGLEVKSLQEYYGME